MHVSVAASGLNWIYRLLFFFAVFFFVVFFTVFFFLVAMGVAPSVRVSRGKLLMRSDRVGRHVKRDLPRGLIQKVTPLARQSRAFPVLRPLLGSRYAVCAIDIESSYPSIDNVIHRTCGRQRCKRPMGAMHGRMITNEC